MLRHSLALACIAFALVAPALAQNPQLVAPTDPLKPAEQREKFHLPPGFEIQLVVADPVIGQPMNLNFDAAGRLWITSSLEYPYPVKGEGVQARDPRFGEPSAHPARDRLVVVEGIGTDGKPSRTSVFAEGFNIPIGVVPTPRGPIVYDIPAIALHRDTDGDGRADERTPLFDGFGNVDTHGMNNGFTRWIDGWIYACHGFRNTSNVRQLAREGQPVVLKMNSGNTYRFREDGSAIEQITWGQVNPFGLTFDQYGNAFTGDCHSMPLTMLLRGAYYSSFGKPHDGLGFGPNMIDHNHGSTGICGPAYYHADHFPPDYRDNLFLCNPVTGRVHRDKLDDRGSTRFVVTQPDFITCDDPWFRPVDCQVGPDGCLYVADFYNAVIGHYEVPLKHPKRDRSLGRVWRIVYRGKEGSIEPPPLPNLEALGFDGLVERLGDQNVVVRTLATNRIVDHHADTATDAVRRLVVRPTESTPEQRAHALWILHRLNALDDDITRQLASDDSPLVRTHLARALGEFEQTSDSDRGLLTKLLADANGFVQRAAAESLGRHPHVGNVQTLLDQMDGVPAADTQLRHAIRIALRNQFRDETVAEEASQPEYTAENGDEIASVLLAVPTERSAALVARFALHKRQSANRTREYTSHVARYGSVETLESVVEPVVESRPEDPPFQLDVLLATADGLRRRGQKGSEKLREFVAHQAMTFLGSKFDRIRWTADGSDAWTVESRRSSDGRTDPFFGTLPRGEQVTGVLRSGAFELPATLSFYVAGHAGPPDREHHGRNLVRLRDAATGLVLATARAPRNDVAQPIEWDLKAHSGKRGYLELVDGDATRSYAWLSVGRFSENALNPSTFEPLEAGVRLVEEFDLDEARPELLALLEDEIAQVDHRLAAARALVALDSDARLDALLSAASSPRTPAGTRDDVLALVADRNDERITKALDAAVRLLPSAEQPAFADQLSADRAGGHALVDLIDRGRLPARLLTRADLRQRLVAARVPDVEKRLVALTKDLPEIDEKIAAAITAHRASFATGDASAERGRLVFEKTCAACHRIGGKGSIVGPQLDGVGIRGIDRLLEDVLDANRNVDAAFRTTTLVLADGKIRTGLVRREEGETLVLADRKGKEFTVRTSDVDERVLSPLSLMPANLHEVLKPGEIDDLLAFLLEQRTKPPAGE